MDSIKREKIHAIQKYKRNQYLKSLFIYSFMALAFLFYSTSFWLPIISSYVEAILLVSVPNLSSAFISIKFVFILGNVIVLALIIGESKGFSNSGSSVNNYYEEYINSRQGLQRSLVPKNNIINHLKKEKFVYSNIVVENNVIKADCEDKYSSVCDEKRMAKFVTRKLEGIDGNSKSCDEVVLPTQELKKRADDFIARVNKRRVFEARESVVYDI